MVKKFITENNVPHHENISYFGNGYNEAVMVYQFTLPPLVLHSFITGDATRLSDWAATIQPPSEKATYFNFLASHDGIGVTPVNGIYAESAINNNTVGGRLFIPSIVSLFNDPEVAARIPVSDPEVYRNAIPRPAAATGTHYNRVSSEFYNAVHDTLAKKKTAEAALKNLEGSLKRISRRGW